MLASQLEAAIGAAKASNTLDNLARILWRALGEGHVDDATASRLSGVVEARRNAFRDAAALGRGRMATTLFPRLRRCVSPDRARSIERRRRHAASGALPPALACHFTTGEIAVLSVVGHEVRDRGRFMWFMDRLAAVAGVSRTTVRNALRQAQALGFLQVRERRRAGRRSDTNVVSILSRDWLSWLKRGGGCKKSRPTNTTSGFQKKDGGDEASMFLSRSRLPGATALYSGHDRTRLPRHPPDGRRSGP